MTNYQATWTRAERALYDRLVSGISRDEAMGRARFECMASLNSMDIVARSPTTRVMVVREALQ